MNNGPTTHRLTRLAALALFCSAVACGDDPVAPASELDADVRESPDVGGDAFDLDADDPSADPDLGDAGDLGRDADADTDDGAGGPDLVEPDAVPDADADAGPVDPSTIDGGEVVEFVPRSLPLDDAAFPLGVQAGVMTASSARLWTYAPAEETVVLRVWRTVDTVGSVAMVFDEVVEGSDAGYFEVEVSPLAPGTWYGYAFYAQRDGELAARSSLGRVRTALAPGALEPITIGATSCTSQSKAPWEALSLMADEELDVIINVGDMSYNDPADTLDEYRAKWRDTLDDPGYRDLLPVAGMYRTWDDHEVANDYNPLDLDDEQFEAALQAYQESGPVRVGETGEIWTSYLWGDTIEFIVMDCRSERRPESIFGGTEYISEAQMAFVQDRLLNSPAHFRVLLNSVPITNMGPIWDAAAADRWEGYAPQRDELLDFIVDNDLHNVWFLAGDFHVGFISQVEPDGERARIREIAVGPGGNGPNPLGAGLALQPQFTYSSLEDEVATIITFDPIENTVHVRFVAADGEVLFDGVLRDAPEE